MSIATIPANMTITIFVILRLIKVSEFFFILAFVA